MGYEPKDPRTNWQMVDYVIDSLLDRGLQPMFTTSFIPSAMASGPVTVFTTQAHTSPPRDWKQWSAFVREAVEHAVDRYSIDVVGSGTLRSGTSRTCRVGSGRSERRFPPALADDLRRNQVRRRPAAGRRSVHRRAEWIEDLLAFGAKHDCPPDYLITHVYNNDSGTAHDPLAPFRRRPAGQGQHVAGFRRGVHASHRALVDRAGFKGELHWNEWGRSFHGVDSRREQASEAAFIVRLLAEVSQEADAFAYWCLSDIYDQVGYGREAFFGGYGLLSLQGLRKPAYHAFQLLGRLGHERVSVAHSEGADSFVNTIVTSSLAAKRAHALVYAYDHADQPCARVSTSRSSCRARQSPPRSIESTRTRTMSSPAGAISVLRPTFRVPRLACSPPTTP
jgi:xylan 1,4-beta-xylosidase